MVFTDLHRQWFSLKSDFTKKLSTQTIPLYEFFCLVFVFNMTVIVYNMNIFVKKKIIPALVLIMAIILNLTVLFLDMKVFVQNMAVIFLNIYATVFVFKYLCRTKI